MARKQTIGIDLEVRTAKAKDELNQMKGSLKGFLADTKKMFGEESQFGMLTKMLMGSGAVAGLTAASVVFEKLGEGFKDAVKTFQDGGKSWGDITIKFSESIPVFGNLVKGTQSFAEGLWYALTTAREMENQMQRNRADWQAAFNQEELDKKAKELVDSLKKTTRDIETSNMAEGIRKELKKVADAQEDAFNDLLKKQAEYKKLTGNEMPVADSFDLSTALVSKFDKDTQDILKKHFLQPVVDDGLNMFEKLIEKIKEIKETATDAINQPALEKITVKQQMGTVRALESRASNFIPSQNNVEYQKQTASNTKTIADVLIKNKGLGGAVNSTLGWLGIGY